MMPATWQFAVRNVHDKAFARLDPIAGLFAAVAPLWCVRPIRSAKITPIE
jgi:hypothetical protein